MQLTDEVKWFNMTTAMVTCLKRDLIKL